VAQKRGGGCPAASALPEYHYVKNMSALLDQHILLRTIRVVLFRQGSR
jgi:lipopolysaccharide/colanic/teichoic acid biosynthesis glycosyltransferase